MLSHELRNPLAPIANAASVLRTLEHSNPILVRLREILERQVGRLGHLIEELIDVTRAAQGQISLVREQVSVESIVQAAVGEQPRQAHRRRPSARGRRARRAPLRARRRGRLAQALAHLIANAAKFTFEPGSISITVRRAAKTVHISVKDSGQGIDPTFLPHAFELFAQQDQTLARTLGGLGVGLTLARRIAQLHGGDVEAFSEGPGRGSEFVLWLPLVEPTRAGASTLDAPRLAESYRVLIVEDDADALESLRLQMELWGNEVSTARNAEEALAVAAACGRRSCSATSACPAWTASAWSRRCARRSPARRWCSPPSPATPAATTRSAPSTAGFDSFLVKPLNPAAWPACCASPRRAPA